MLSLTLMTEKNGDFYRVKVRYASLQFSNSDSYCPPCLVIAKKEQVVDEVQRPVSTFSFTFDIVKWACRQA